MQMKLVATVSATQGATEYSTAGYDSPFQVGNTVVGMLVKSGNFAGDNVTIRTSDKITSGVAGWTTVRAAADADSATTGDVELFQFQVGDDIEITAAAVTAGSFKFYLLG